LALLNEPTEVDDKPNAPDLIVNHGEIEFGESDLVMFFMSLNILHRKR
jgi:hypothetical protein